MKLQIVGLMVSADGAQHGSGLIQLSSPRAGVPRVWEREFKTKQTQDRGFG